MQHFTPQDVVYVVAVGTSQREQTKRDLVREYCIDCGLYFKVRSGESDTAIENLKKATFKGWNFMFSPLKMAYVSINDLYRLIIDDEFIFFENYLEEHTGTFSFKRKYDPYFYFIQKKRASANPTATETRKYLKSCRQQEFSSAIVGFALILATFLFAAWLEGRAQY